MTYDVAAVRSQYPALTSGEAFFDGPGGTQVPRPVVDALATTLASPVSNRGPYTAPQRAADEIVHACRAALGDLLAADPRGIVFGRSMTQVTYDLSRAIAKTWEPCDEVVVSRLDHDGNARPWVQAAEARDVTVRWIDFDPETAELTPVDLEAVLSDRTRLVAVTAASNVLGTMPDVAALTELAHRAGALVYVDGVHYAAHEAVDVAALGADFFACLVAGPATGDADTTFSVLAYARTIISNMFVRLRFSAAAHCSHNSRTSGVIFRDVAAVFRSGRGMASEVTEF